MRIQYTLLTAAVAAALVSSSYAQDVSQSGTFEAHTGQGMVTVAANSGYQRADVAYTNATGVTNHFQFAAGEAIHFAAPKADGVYPFRVVLTPTQGLRVGADNHEGRVPREGIDTAALAEPNLFYEGQIVVSQGQVQLVDANDFETAETLVSDDDESRALEAPTPRQTIAEDLMVQGSACVGGDCTTAEAFGSDTFRLKENNLRIHFDDSSASGSFPFNDWRITINDSVNGGSNYFSVDDATNSRTVLRLDAAARANSIYVGPQVSAAGGNNPRVGIGTSSPAVQMHVFGSDTPTVRLEQVGSFGNYTWDLAGNESNLFIRSVTNSSVLPFRIRSQAVFNTLMLGNNGRVGVDLAGGNNANPQAILHIGSNTATTSDTLLRVDNSTAATVLSLNDEGDMTLAGTLSQLSSEKAKEHFSDIDTQELLDALRQMQIYTWNYKHQQPSERHLGPTAEGFYAAFGLGKDPQHIAVSDMAGVALAASQVMAERLVEKEQQIELLEQRMQAMELMMQRVLDQQSVADTTVTNTVAQQ